MMTCWYVIALLASSAMLALSEPWIEAFSLCSCRERKRTEEGRARGRGGGGGGRPERLDWPCRHSAANSSCWLDLVSWASPRR
eukprot:747254-Hanusia_phi.AAC.5